MQLQPVLRGGFGRLTIRDVVASLTLVAIGLAVTPVIGLALLLVD